ncbi:hypothetical protein SAMN06269301_3189 [Geobacter sp. DSM 9736]|nr:hypothetical protein SAMN06269301_3189 [Geobacter sp. DSM 9736]
MLFDSGCHAEPLPIIRQDISVVLAPSSGRLAGETNVLLAGGDVRKIFFRLSPAATVTSVSTGHKKIPFSFSDGLLTLSGVWGTSITIRYECVFNDPLPDRIISTEDPTYGVQAVIAPSGVFLGDGVGWYPEPETVPGERMVSVDAPEGFEAVTAGECVKRGTSGGRTVSTWRITAPLPGISVSAGPYRVSERRETGRTLAAYFYAENALLADRYLGSAAEYLSFYEKLLGPYPFPKFAIVENFLPTGYGFPSYTLIGSTVIRLPFILGTSLPHEIVHNWWGNGVRVDYSGGNWSEGLATYLADYLLEEKKSPALGREYRLKILADYASLVSSQEDFPLARFTGRTEPSSRSIGYGKAAMVFHMVRRMIGDDAFYKALRTVYRERVFREASWDDLMRAFSAASGKDLIPWMDQWLKRPGGPQIALREVKARREGDGWLVSGFIVQAAAARYKISVPLRLKTRSGDVAATVYMRGERTPFLIAAGAEPSRLLLDPDVELFRILSPEELPPTVNRIKGSRNFTLVRTASCRARDETLRDLLSSLGQGEVSMVREENLQSDVFRDHDILFCGVPRSEEKWPLLLPQLTIGADGFTAEEKRFAGAGDALLAIGKHPVDPGRTAAVFLPMSPSAAEACALKITHYGKYSYLAFSDGKNRVKVTLPVQGGESVVDLGGADE